VAAQGRDPTSMLALYREALRLRREVLDAEPATLEWVAAPPAPGVLVFRRGAVECWVNFGPDPVPLPDAVAGADGGADGGAEVLLTSVPPQEGSLPADGAAWVRRVTHVGDVGKRR
jgi:alpha-glucosidase